jgi:tRNA (cytidine/uridine-2'-O-)-methyltransferase
VSGPLVEIVLYQPLIPQNTGNVGRLCVGLEARLHLVHPLAFDTSEKAVRRAGLDYWKLVDLIEHPDPDAFWAWLGDRRFHLFSTAGAVSYTAVRYQPGDALIFGCETVGLPRELVARHGAVFIPCPGPIRSLNLSNAVSVVAYEALRQLRPSLF